MYKRGDWVRDPDPNTPFQHMLVITASPVWPYWLLVWVNGKEKKMFGIIMASDVLPGEPDA